MKKAKAEPKLKICSRGHKFWKSSDCPACPVCWPGFYKKKIASDFPESMSAPSLRALAGAKIKTVKQLAKHAEAEIAALHGMGPKGISMLRAALRKQGMSFAPQKKTGKK